MYPNLRYNLFVSDSKLDAALSVFGARGWKRKVSGREFLGGIDLIENSALRLCLAGSAVMFAYGSHARLLFTPARETTKSAKIGKVTPPLSSPPKPLAAVPTLIPISNPPTSQRPPPYPHRTGPHRLSAPLIIYTRLIDLIIPAINLQPVPRTASTTTTLLPPPTRTRCSKAIQPPDSAACGLPVFLSGRLSTSCGHLT
jgi:hypothetical protein